MRRRAAMSVIGALAIVLTGCQSTTTARNEGERAPTARAGSVRPVAATPVPLTKPSTKPSTTPSAAVASSRPKPNPCAKNTAPQLVRVSLRAQHLWMCDHRRMAYGTPITSGIVGQYTSTPTGHYTIQALDRHQTLTLIDGSQFTVDYWIPFDAPLFGFHDSPWQHFPYGSARYRTKGSHGCVHMPHRAIAHLYRWAHVGTEVHIQA